MTNVKLPVSSLMTKHVTACLEIVHHINNIKDGIAVVI